MKSPLTLRRIHWQRSSVVQASTCMTPSLIADHPETYASPRFNIKRHGAESRQIPRDGATSLDHQVAENGEEGW